jgi:hypothetical protein
MANIDPIRAIATGCIAALVLAFYAAPHVAHPSADPPVEAQSVEAQATDSDPTRTLALEDVDASTMPEPLAFDGGFPPAILIARRAKAPDEYPPRSPIDAASFEDAGANRIATAEPTP